MKRIGIAALSAVVALALASCGGGQAAERKTEIWDFGSEQEEREGVVNNIRASDFDSLSDEVLAGDGKFKKGEVKFGDLTLNVENNDRLYYGSDDGPGKKNYGSQGYCVTDFDDGYSSNGLYYANGKGGAERRFMRLDNVKAGDVVSFYARISNSGEEEIFFANVDAEGNETGIQTEKADLTSEARKYSYIAQADGSYKVYAGASVGKPVYFRLVREPAVSVSGKIDGMRGGASLKFIVKETNQELPAKVSGKSYTASLPAGHSFSAVLQDAPGFSISSDTRVFSVEQALAGKSADVNLSVAEAKLYKAGGKIALSGEYDAPKMGIVFNPPEGGIYQPVPGKVSRDGSEFRYEAELEPGVDYTAALTDANDYEIIGGGKFSSTDDIAQDIRAKAKSVQAVSGKFFGEVSEIPEKIEFRRLDDGYVYGGKIGADGKFSASLRDGSYEVLAETQSARTKNHVVVSGSPVGKDVRLSLKEEKVQQIPLRKTLRVGRTREFTRVSDAVRAARAMNPQGEADRITIEIEPGTYREQISIDVPFVTLRNASPGREVKLTWYYGIGYLYYSAGEDGFFDEDLAYDKFTKKAVAKWGGATYVRAKAKGFRAEGITFETSFNKYITDEEIADGVESDGSIKFARSYGADVRSKEGTERSAAILIEADETEFLNCSFLGSQDTLYTGSKIRGYLRNCLIEGQTDFIFGDGTFVFENCEIRWCGYTDKPSAGYMTAARTSEGRGYLFLNCLVSRNENVYNAPGFFGRPWGADAAVAFVNTVLSTDEAVDDAGWTKMSSNDPAKAKFREVNTIWEGSDLDLSSRVAGTVAKDDGGYTTGGYLGDWKPVYATGKKGAAAFARRPSLTTDDDINTPYPGHTITLHYSLGDMDGEDASRIYWFRVKDGKAELVKQSAGFGDRTYQIQAEDSGSKIVAKVSPRTRGGDVGADAEIALEAAVNEGYSAPSNAAADVPRVFGAVNVFLASDSTCKDYSAKGMWSSNQTRNEGAWGEFLQEFFNSTVAVQNYANGGRSTRNFINEGSLDKIAGNISKGDFLFIQFGHNDCSNASGYLEDRYVPLGKPDASGNYPVTEGKKVATPDSYRAKYGDTFYAWDSGGTYKWFLKQYIDVARSAGATPVLVTPVSRMYFSEGKIRPHHDSTEETAGTLKTSGNAYVEAVRQLAKEENVILIDGFELTKTLYESAWAARGEDSEARSLMFQGDSTHNNKLGGFVIAGEFAKAIREKIPALAKSVRRPAKAAGVNSDGKSMFSVDGDGNFRCESDYWTRRENEFLKNFK